MDLINLAPELLFWEQRVAGSRQLLLLLLLLL